MARRHPAAPWLRPPPRSLEVVEDFISRLSGYGFADQRTLPKLQQLLLGQLHLESAVRGVQTSPVEHPVDEGDAAIPKP